MWPVCLYGLVRGAIVAMLTASVLRFILAMLTPDYSDPEPATSRWVVAALVAVVWIPSVVLGVIEARRTVKVWVTRSGPTDRLHTAPRSATTDSGDTEQPRGSAGSVR